MSLRAPARRTALLTLLYLGGGIVLSFPASALAADLAAGVGIRATPALLVVALFACCGVAGLLWGRHLGALFVGRDGAWRLGVAAGVGFGLSAAAALRTLTGIEAFLLEQEQLGAAPLSMHVAFGLAFGVATFEVVTGTALALLLAAGWRRRAVTGALGPALVGAAVFVGVAAIMDRLGWRVGAPGAEARATMVVVTALALVLATLAAGGVLGRLLAARGPAR